MELKEEERDRKRGREIVFEWVKRENKKRKTIVIKDKLRKNEELRNKKMKGKYKSKKKKRWCKNIEISFIATSSSLPHGLLNGVDKFELMKREI